MPWILIVSTTVRGYHVYRAVWNLSIGEDFVVLLQAGNGHDCHAMAVYRLDDPGVIVGHIPTRHNGKITGEVTGLRRYCKMVGSIGIPCILQFLGQPGTYRCYEEI